MPAKPISLRLDAETQVSALWDTPRGTTAALVLARGVAVFRFNFAYMERGSRRPDSPPLAHAAIRAAVAHAKKLAGDLPLFAGGRSFGGRMTSQAQALDPLPGVKGLVFFAFPIHPAGKPATDRADHLAAIKLPMLFLQGTTDALAETGLLKPVVAGLGKRAKLHLVDKADHSFHVPAKSGRRDPDVLNEILDVTAAWMAKLS
jgi:hypothetical protein